MRVLETAAENLRLFGVLFALVIGGFLALGLGLGFALMTNGVLASHDDPNTIHACVKQNNGSARILLSSAPPTCGNNEVLIEWQNAAGFADLEIQVASLVSQVAELEVENDTQATQISDLKTTVADQEAQVGDLETALAGLAGQLPECLSEDQGDAVFSGCNVYVNNGLDSTATTNGTGNLIIGYNEDFSGQDDRTGSHNLVVGEQHSYSSWGGFVAGVNNTISGIASSITGGTFNEASRFASSVSGGLGNTASGEWSSVSGGSDNIASEEFSSISGGWENEASGRWSSVSGGRNNDASGFASSVSGGSDNTASDNFTSVSGGEGNTAETVWASVGGGWNLTTTFSHDFLP